MIFAGHRTGVNCLSFSKDGLMLASGGKVSSASVLQILFGIELAVFLFRTKTSILFLY